MQIYVARQGAEIGNYPREQLESLARAGKLQPNDHYWKEGMPDWVLLSELLGAAAWQPLPPPPAPPFYRRRLALAIAIVAGFILLMLIGVWSINKESAETANKNALLRPPASVMRTAETEDQVRDRAAADLKQKIDRLPAQATPPLDAFYYDVRVEMKKSLERRTPWTATIAGGENLVDPASQETIRRTEFTLTADYHDGAWAYRNYRATATDPQTSAITEIFDDEEAPAPPSIVGMLGLKRERH